MYSVSGLNILGWKFVVQSESVTIQNNSREQLVFFLHTGALFANDHYTATNDLCNNIDIYNNYLKSRRIVAKYSGKYSSGKYS